MQGRLGSYSGSALHALLKRDCDRQLQDGERMRPKLREREALTLLECAVGQVGRDQDDEKLCVHNSVFGFVAPISIGLRRTPHEVRTRKLAKGRTGIGSKGAR